MIEILLAIIAVTSLSILVTYLGDDDTILNAILSPIFTIIGLILLCIYILLGWDYIASEYKADIINEEFGTSYTQEQIFYASDVIDEVRNLERKRVEINGNLMTGEKP